MENLLPQIIFSLFLTISFYAIVCYSQDQESVQFQAFGAPYTDGIHYSSDQVIVTAPTSVPRNSLYTGHSKDQIIEEQSVEYDSDGELVLSDGDQLDYLTYEQREELNKPVTDFRPLQAELRNRLKLQTSHSHSHFTNLPNVSDIDTESWLPESTLDIKAHLATGGSSRRGTLQEALSIRGASRGSKFTNAAKSSFLAGEYLYCCCCFNEAYLFYLCIGYMNISTLNQYFD